MILFQVQAKNMISSTRVATLLLSLATVTCAVSRQDEANSHLFSEAFQLMGRATSTSEVLSLNLTNLIILLALKFVIFSIGLFSGGLGAGGPVTPTPGAGRSVDSSSGYGQGI